MAHTYEFPRPAFVVDAITYAIDPPVTYETASGEFEALRYNPKYLLIRRGEEPFEGCWAFPGGHVEEGETSLTACLRELEEETGVGCEDIFHSNFVGLADAPGRDPRGWVISAVYKVEVKNGVVPVAGDDAAETKWFTWEELLADDFPWAFDHGALFRKWA